MQFFKRTFGGLILTIILAFIVLLIREPRLFTEPNTWLIGDTYDGFRTFAALVYHVEHDSTYTNYEGMNYPYGDKVAFTDNLPLIANSIKYIDRNIADISAYCGGILNGFLMTSIILAAVFIFLSFRRLELPVWYATPVAVGVALLSPQLFRLSAHYGLAHPFVIPLFVWLSLLFHKNKRWGYSLLIAGALFLVAQLHFYLFAISAAFILALMSFKTLFAFNKKALVINGLHLLVQIFIPFLLLQLMLHDSLPDRPTRPWGFFAYKARWESVFIPIDFQIGRWIDEYVYKIPHFDREGIAYIGLIAVGFFFKEFFIKIKNRFFGYDYQSILPDNHRFFLKSAFWAAFLILIFSLGIPFIFPGFRELPNQLGILAQFRSIGRFAWVFFYVFNIIAFYALYFQIKKIRKQGWQTIVYGVLIGILLAESGIFLFDKVKLRLVENPSIRTDFQRSDQGWLDTLDLDNYQAILSVPFFHIGSENIWISPVNKEVHRSLWLSVQTGLPINSSFMGRTSVGQVINQLELIAEPYRAAKLLDDLPSDKDFLVFLHKKAYQAKGRNRPHLLNDLPLLHEDEDIQVYQLSIQKLKDRIQASEEFAQQNYHTTTRYSYDDLESTDSVRNYVYLSFDGQTAIKKYQGTGAYEASGFPETTVFEGHIPFQQNQENYTFSAWFYVQGDLNPKIKISIEEFQMGTDFLFYKNVYEPYKYFRSIENGWLLAEFPFRLARGDSWIKIKAWNRSLGERPLFIDELQLRPKSTDLYLRQGDQLMENNRWWELGKQNPNKR